MLAATPSAPAAATCACTDASGSEKAVIAPAATTEAARTLRRRSTACAAAAGALGRCTGSVPSGHRVRHHGDLAGRPPVAELELDRRRQVSEEPCPGPEEYRNHVQHQFIDETGTQELERDV